jgi:osmoprotectant transport system permease protein
MIRYAAAALLLLALALVPFSSARTGLKIGSKKFTESVILGELLAHLARDTGFPAAHFQELGGTKLVFDALRAGDIDIYPEYTGTIREEILAGQQIDDDQQLRRALEEQGVLMSRPLGFNNSYALGMKQERVNQLGLKTISDLARRPDLRYGFSSEFMDREDGWPSLRRHYGLAPRQAQGMDHDLAYRQLDAGSIDVTDVYTTDAKINVYGIAMLEDDRQYFPRCDAVLLYRADLADRHPRLVKALRKLEGQIDDASMTHMNARAELARATLDRVSESRVAADFLADRLNIRVEVAEQTAVSRLWKHTVEHIDLVRKSLLPAILVAIPLGIFATRRRVAGQLILASVGIIQTIPALALLVILMKPVSLVGLSSIGAGSVNAVVALFLYSLLPIVRNTYAGLKEIPPGIHESALAIGLPETARLRLRPLES